MRALHFDARLQYRSDAPDPTPSPGEALIRTRLAGICNTDMEIVRGFLGFTGVLGHEFVGTVDDGPVADQSPPETAFNPQPRRPS